MIRTSRLQRGIAGAMALILLASTVSAPLAEANFWKERQKSVSSRNQPSVSVARLPGAMSDINTALPSVSVEKGLPWKSLDRAASVVNRESLRPRSSQKADGALPAWARSLPSAYGDIQKIQMAPHPDKSPLVVLIQDAHDVYSAQINIAHILDHLQNNMSKPGEPLLVGVEGGIGAFNLPPYRHFREWGMKNYTEVSESLLRDGHINGSEYFGLMAEREPLLWGVETPADYMANVESYRKGLPVKADMKEALKDLSQALAPAKEKIFSPELKAFDGNLEQYHAGALDMVSYVKFLAEQDQAAADRLPQVRRFLRALDTEKSLDFKQVELERAQLLQVLSRKLSETDLRALMNYSLAYKQGNIGYDDYYSYLKRLTSGSGIRLSVYPAFDRYIQYILLCEKIEPAGLFGEIESLKSAAGSRLAKTPAQKEILRAGEDLRLLSRLAANEFTPSEWTLYLSRRSALESLPARVQAIARGAGLSPALDISLSALLPVFEEFYAAASRRNDSMVENILNKLGEGQNAAMVTGGFHTATLQALLKDKQISFVTITPKIGKVESGAKYLDVFSTRRTPLEKMLLGEKLLMNPPSAINVAAMAGSAVESRPDPARISFIQNFRYLLEVFNGMWASLWVGVLVRQLSRETGRDATKMMAAFGETLQAKIGEIEPTMSLADFGEKIFPILIRYFRNELGLEVENGGIKDSGDSLSIHLILNGKSILLKVPKGSAADAESKISLSPGPQAGWWSRIMDFFHNNFPGFGFGWATADGPAVIPVDQSTPPIIQHASLTVQSASGKPRILVVDDEEQYRESFEKILTYDGFEVTTARGGNEAIKLFEAQDFDLVITDMDMPEGNGLQLTTAIKKLKNIPVIMLTARDTGEDRKNAKAAGADDFLTKPIMAKDLVESIKALLPKAPQASLYKNYDEIKSRLTKLFIWLCVGQQNIDIWHSRNNADATEGQKWYREVIAPRWESEAFGLKLFAVWSVASVGVFEISRLLPFFQVEFFLALTTLLLPAIGILLTNLFAEKHKPKIEAMTEDVTAFNEAFHALRAGLRIMNLRGYEWAIRMFVIFGWLGYFLFPGDFGRMMVPVAGFIAYRVYTGMHKKRHLEFNKDRDEASSANLPALNQPAILVVNIEQNATRALSSLLEEEFPGYNVIAVKSIAEAIEKLNSNPGIKLVITERNIGHGKGEKGENLIQDIRKFNPNIPILFKLDSRIIPSEIRGMADTFINISFNYSDDLRAKLRWMKSKVSKYNLSIFSGPWWYETFLAEWESVALGLVAGVATLFTTAFLLTLALPVLSPLAIPAFWVGACFSAFLFLFGALASLELADLHIEKLRRISPSTLSEDYKRILYKLLGMHFLSWAASTWILLVGLQGASPMAIPLMDSFVPFYQAVAVYIAVHTALHYAHNIFIARRAWIGKIKNPGQNFLSAASTKPTILVVDDTPVNVMTYTEYLEAKGYVVITAFNGREALDALRSTNVALVFTDKDMPVMNGTELAQAMREDPKLKRIPIILATANDADEGHPERLGVDMVFQRPVGLKKLLEGIQELLPSTDDGSAPLSVFNAPPKSWRPFIRFVLLRDKKLMDEFEKLEIEHANWAPTYYGEEHPAQKFYQEKVAPVWESRVFAVVAFAVSMALFLSLSTYVSPLMFPVFQFLVGVPLSWLGKQAHREKGKRQATEEGTPPVGILEIMRESQDAFQNMKVEPDLKTIGKGLQLTNLAGAITALAAVVSFHIPMSLFNFVPQGIPLQQIFEYGVVLYFYGFGHHFMHQDWNESHGRGQRMSVPLPAGKPNILIVDNDTLYGIQLRLALIEKLPADTYEIEWVSNADHGVDYFKSHKNVVMVLTTVAACDRFLDLPSRGTQVVLMRDPHKKVEDKYKLPSFKKGDFGMESVAVMVENLLKPDSQMPDEGMLSAFSGPWWYETFLAEWESVALGFVAGVGSLAVTAAMSAVIFVVQGSLPATEHIGTIFILSFAGLGALASQKLAHSHLDKLKRISPETWREDFARVELKLFGIHTVSTAVLGWIIYSGLQSASPVDMPIAQIVMALIIGGGAYIAAHTALHYAHNIFIAWQAWIDKIKNPSRYFLSVASKKPRILVVDDSREYREKIQALLNKGDKFVVVTAEDAFKALDILKDQMFDLIVTDNVMPKMSGYELAAAVRKTKRHKDVPIIMETSEADSDAVYMAQLAGINLVISKFDLDKKLLKQISAHLKKSGRMVLRPAPQWFENWMAKWPAGRKAFFRKILRAHPGIDLAQDHFLAQEVWEQLTVPGPESLFFGGITVAGALWGASLAAGSTAIHTYNVFFAAAIFVGVLFVLGLIVALIFTEMHPDDRKVGYAPVMGHIVSVIPPVLIAMAVPVIYLLGGTPIPAVVQVFSWLAFPGTMLIPVLGAIAFLAVLTFDHLRHNRFSPPQKRMNLNASPAAPTKPRILVVDDGESERALVGAILTRAGYECEFATDGVQAFNMLQEQGSFSLVVTDTKMPNLDGLGLIGMIRADDKLRNIPVIMTSADDPITAKAAAVQAGADIFVAKPFSNILELPAAVAELLKRSTGGVLEIGFWLFNHLIMPLFVPIINWTLRFFYPKKQLPTAISLATYAKWWAGLTENLSLAFIVMPVILLLPGVATLAPLPLRILTWVLFVTAHIIEHYVIWKMRGRAPPASRIWISLVIAVFCAALGLSPQNPIAIAIHSAFNLAVHINATQNNGGTVSDNQKKLMEQGFEPEFAGIVADIENNAATIRDILTTPISPYKEPQEQRVIEVLRNYSKRNPQIKSFRLLGDESAQDMNAEGKFHMVVKQENMDLGRQSLSVGTLISIYDANNKLMGSVSFLNGPITTITVTDGKHTQHYLTEFIQRDKKFDLGLPAKDSSPAAIGDTFLRWPRFFQDYYRAHRGVTALVKSKKGSINPGVLKKRYGAWNNIPATSANVYEILVNNGFLAQIMPAEEAVLWGQFALGAKGRAIVLTGRGELIDLAKETMPAEVKTVQLYAGNVSAVDELEKACKQQEQIHRIGIGMEDAMKVPNEPGYEHVDYQLGAGLTDFVSALDISTVMNGEEKEEFLAALGQVQHCAARIPRMYEAGGRGAGTSNASGDDQKEIDTASEVLFIENLRHYVNAYYSEEGREFVNVNGKYFAIMVDPLDGSSKVESNGGGGTIGAFIRTEKGDSVTDKTPRGSVVASFSITYGVETRMFIAFPGKGTHEFLLVDGQFRYLQQVILPEQVNPDLGLRVALGGAESEWPAGFPELVDEWTEEGAMPGYSGALVTDAVAVLKHAMAGGQAIFAYLANKLRHRYEEIAIAMILEEARGDSLTHDFEKISEQNVAVRVQNVLDRTIAHELPDPENEGGWVHQKAPFAFGDKKTMQLVRERIIGAAQGVSDVGPRAFAASLYQEITDATPMWLQWFIHCVVGNKLWKVYFDPQWKVFPKDLRINVYETRIAPVWESRLFGWMVALLTSAVIVLIYAIFPNIFINSMGGWNIYGTGAVAVSALLLSGGVLSFYYAEKHNKIILMKVGNNLLDFAKAKATLSSGLNWMHGVSSLAFLATFAWVAPLVGSMSTMSGLQLGPELSLAISILFAFEIYTRVHTIMHRRHNRRNFSPARASLPMPAIQGGSVAVTAIPPVDREILDRLMPAVQAEAIQALIHKIGYLEALRMFGLKDVSASENPDAGVIAVMLDATLPQFVAAGSATDVEAAIAVLRARLASMGELSRDFAEQQRTAPERAALNYHRYAANMFLLQGRIVSDFPGFAAFAGPLTGELLALGDALKGEIVSGPKQVSAAEWLLDWGAHLAQDFQFRNDDKKPRQFWTDLRSMDKTTLARLAAELNKLNKETANQNRLMIVTGEASPEAFARMLRLAMDGQELSQVVLDDIQTILANIGSPKMTVVTNVANGPLKIYSLFESLEGFDWRNELANYKVSIITAQYADWLAGWEDVLAQLKNGGAITLDNMVEFVLQLTRLDYLLAKPSEMGGYLEAVRAIMIAA